MEKIESCGGEQITLVTLTNQDKPVKEEDKVQEI